MIYEQLYDLFFCLLLYLFAYCLLPIAYCSPKRHCANCNATALCSDSVMPGQRYAPTALCPDSVMPSQRYALPRLEGTYRPTYAK